MHLFYYYYVKPIKEYRSIQAETKEEAIQLVKTLQKIKNPRVMTLEEFKSYLVNKEGWAVTSEMANEVTFKRKKRKVDWSIFFLLLCAGIVPGVLYLIYCLLFKPYDVETHRLKL